MPVRLTARNVRTLSSQGRPRADYLDDVLPGFELRVSSAEVRTFAIRYFRDGKVRRTRSGGPLRSPWRMPGTSRGEYSGTS